VTRSRVLHCEARGVFFDIALDPALPIEVWRALAPLAAETAESRHARSATFACEIRREPAHLARWDLLIDDKIHLSSELVSELLSGLFHFLTPRVIACREDILSVHASAVARDGHGLLLPASSGSGKTTLCARLLESGFAYLTDESTGLTTSGELLGFAKPLGLKSGARATLPEQVFDNWWLDPAGQSVWHVPAEEFGGRVTAAASATCIAFPEFRPDAVAQLTPLSSAHATLRLIENAQNIPALGFDDAVAIAATTVARSGCYSLIHGDAVAAASLLLGAVRSRDVQHERPWRVFHSPSSHERGRPALASGVRAVCFEDGALLYEPDSARLVVSDRIGGSIVALLDGTRTLGALAAAVAPRFDAPADRIARELTPWLEELARDGLLTT
jgi:hypothetical protein